MTSDAVHRYQFLVPVLLVVGIGLISYSFLHPDGDHGRSDWTTKQAASLREAGIRLHDLALQNSTDSSPELRREFYDVREEYERLEEARLRAIKDARVSSLILQRVGLVLGLLGAAMHLIAKARLQA